MARRARPIYADFDENSESPTGTIARLRVPEGSARNRSVPGRLRPRRDRSGLLRFGRVRRPWPDIEGAIGSFDPRNRCLPDPQSRDAHRGRNPDRLHEVAVWNFEMPDGCHASFSDVVAVGRSMPRSRIANSSPPYRATKSSAESGLGGVLRARTGTPSTGHSLRGLVLELSEEHARSVGRAKWRPVCGLLMARDQSAIPGSSLTRLRENSRRATEGRAGLSSRVFGRTSPRDTLREGGFGERMSRRPRRATLRPSLGLRAQRESR